MTSAYNTIMIQLRRHGTNSMKVEIFRVIVVRPTFSIVEVDVYYFHGI